MLHFLEFLLWLDERLPHWRIGLTLVAGILLSAFAFWLIPSRNAGGIACIVISLAGLELGFRWQAASRR